MGIGEFGTAVVSTIFPTYFDFWLDFWNHSSTKGIAAIPDALDLLAIISRLPDGIIGGSEQLIEMDLGLDDVDEATGSK